MKKNLIKSCLLLTFAPLLSVTHAVGAVITWDVAATNVDVNNAGQVSNAGTLFAAASTKAQIYSTVYTVNGVAFNAFNSNLSWGFTNNAAFSPGAGTNYQGLLSAGNYLFDTSSNANPITLTGLTAGQSYLIQIWTPFWNTLNYSTRVNSSAPTGPSYDHATGESPTMQLGLNYSPTLNPPQFVLGTFSADLSGTQNIYYFGDTGIGIISAVQVRAVPEPATIGLAAFGLVALIVRHRSRRSLLIA